VATRTLRFPTTVTIGPHHYDLDISTQGINEAKVEMKQLNLAGAIRYQHNSITIDPEMHPDRLVEVILHECLHGIWDLSGLPDEGESDETVITMFAPNLIRFFRDNPDLMKVLCKEVA
jgi:hypothetical protein